MADYAEYPEFEAPMGFEIPEEEEFETVVTLRKKDNGRLCVIKVEGIPLAEKEEPNESESEGSEAMGFAEMMGLNDYA